MNIKDDLISREELKKALENPSDKHYLSKSILDLVFKRIDDAPSVEEVSVIEFKEPLPLVKAQKIVKALSKRPQGDWIRLDLAKRVIAKFEGYLDEDMIARIQIALEKENEAEMKGGAE